MLTLEAVQNFYQVIMEEPQEATMVEERFIDLCRSMKNGVVPVVTLMLNNKDENQDYYHAVTLRSSVRLESFLEITLSDSRSISDQIAIMISVSDLSTFESRENYVSVRRDEKWYLGDEMCYYFVFN